MPQSQKPDQVSTEDLINVKDFSSIQMIINIINLTTQTRLEKDSIFYGQKVVDSGPHCNAELLEFLDDGIIIDIPPKLGATGHIFTIKVTTQGAPEDISVEFNSVVKEIEKNNDRLRCTLKNQQHKDSQFKKLVDLFTNRQQEIAALLESMRGF